MGQGSGFKGSKVQGFKGSKVRSGSANAMPGHVLDVHPFNSSAFSSLS